MKLDPLENSLWVVTPVKGYLELKDVLETASVLPAASWSSFIFSSSSLSIHLFLSIFSLPFPPLVSPAYVPLVVLLH